MEQSNKNSDALTVSSSDKPHSADCEYSPVVILPGINHSPTYLYDKDDKPIFSGESHIGGTMLIINKDALTKSALRDIVVRALASVFIQGDAGLYKSVYSLVSEALKYQRCDKNGNHVENLKTKCWYHSIGEMTKDELNWTYRMVPMKSLVDEIGEDHVYFFTFNLVGDPMNSADELDEYIELVKKQTGHDKVTLLPISLGGTILTAYLEKYGHEKIDKIVNMVACLDGTDIVADFYSRKWRLDDEYLYHRFFENIFTESNGNPTKGYIINTLLHLFPRAAVNGVLSGAISAVLDTLMLNCPQFWAMLPSYRYDELAVRYLSDNPVLKERTDRFQTARINLKDNLLKAVADGVRVNSIACANLDIGEQIYTYFNIVDSANKVNSDGIVNLSSTTLGATGTNKYNSLSDYKKNKYCNNDDHNHISADKKVDASTALFPENTWIFLNQHHEVGSNDVVLNLAKALILGKIVDVNTDPTNYPQYNGACNTMRLRRWMLPDALKVNQSLLNNEDKAELNAAIGEARDVLNLTISDQLRVEKAEKQLDSILKKIGAEGYKNTKPARKSPLAPALEAVTRGLSKGTLSLLGGGSLVDKAVKIIKSIIK